MSGHLDHKPAPETFVLTIELGNDAMNGPRDIAAALAKAAGKLRKGQTVGAILDENGNTVGRFGIE